MSSVAAAKLRSLFSAGSELGLHFGPFSAVLVFCAHWNRAAVASSYENMANPALVLVAVVHRGMFVGGEWDVVSETLQGVATLCVHSAEKKKQEPALLSLNVILKHKHMGR